MAPRNLSNSPSDHVPDSVPQAVVDLEQLLDMKLLLVLLAAVLVAADATLYDVSALGDEDELLLGEAPADEPCGFKQFVRENLTPLRNYG